MPSLDNEIAPLIQTKLNRPPVPVNLVGRPQLIQRLERQRRRPLSLVSAPAGYGKSTLVSSWLEKLDSPAAWLSLDEYDNDLAAFLSYFIAAIQTMFPEAMADTLAMLRIADLPPQQLLMSSLVNELTDIASSFYLVLDDYHLIHEITIHDFLNELLQHPPRGLHLVICTRMDPLINLVNLRAHSQVTEIRAQDLRFTVEETILLLEKILGEPVDKSTATELEARSEGWVTGLYLAALALRHRAGEERFLGDLTVNNRYVADYMMSEILTKQAPRLSDCLLRSSIPKRFNAELCEAICFPETDGSLGEGHPEKIKGEVFLEWLETSNLFVIPLDDESRWFRYHHLFRRFLLDEIARRLNIEEIGELQDRACEWCEQNGLIEEALHHALAKDDPKSAAVIIEIHRHDLMERERWQRLRRWISQLPRELVESRPQLLLIDAWYLATQFRLGELPPILERIKAMIEEDSPDSSEEDKAVLRGEIAALWSLILYWLGQGQQSLDYATHALEVTPLDHRWVRGVASTYHIGAHQLVGKQDRVYDLVQMALTEDRQYGSITTHRIYMGLMLSEILAGDLQSAEQTAIKLQDVTRFHKLYVTGGTAYLGRAFICYVRNDLEGALRHYEDLVELRYQVNAETLIQGLFGLALTYHAMGRADRARKTSEEAFAWARERESRRMMIEAQSLASRLDLLDGQVPDVKHWADHLGDTFSLMVMPEIPHLTLAKFLIAQGTTDSLKQAADLLSKLDLFVENTHDNWHLIEVRALQALYHDALNERATAIECLEKALELDRSGSFIRLFVDLGSNMAKLLEELSRQGVAKEYSAQILAAFSSARPALSSVDQGQLIEPLTERELEVLALLVKRRTNKEIAAELVISPGTVKQHAHNIYQKLNVKGRRQAVREAIELGILTPE